VDGSDSVVEFKEKQRGFNIKKKHFVGNFFFPTISPVQSLLFFIFQRTKSSTTQENDYQDGW